MIRGLRLRLLHLTLTACLVKSGFTWIRYVDLRVVLSPLNFNRLTQLLQLQSFHFERLRILTHVLLENVVGSIAREQRAFLLICFQRRFSMEETWRSPLGRIVDWSAFRRRRSCFAVRRLLILACLFWRTLQRIGCSGYAIIFCWAKESALWNWIMPPPTIFFDAAGEGKRLHISFLRKKQAVTLAFRCSLWASLARDFRCVLLYELKLIGDSRRNLAKLVCWLWL